MSLAQNITLIAHKPERVDVSRLVEALVRARWAARVIDAPEGLGLEWTERGRRRMERLGEILRTVGDWYFDRTGVKPGRGAQMWAEVRAQWVAWPVRRRGLRGRRAVLELFVVAIMADRQWRGKV